MITHNVEQGSKKWLKLRLGTPTASEVKKIIKSTSKKGVVTYSESAQFPGYALKLALEMAGVDLKKFKTDATERGHELEPTARNTYSFEYEEAREVGFCTTDDYERGWSPDGLVGKDGCIEIKTMTVDIFAKVLLSDEMPKEHIPQVQMGLLVSKLKWCDFIAYCDDMPENKEMLVIRQLPDLEFQEALSLLLDDLIELRDEFYLNKLDGTQEELEAFKAMKEER